MKGQILKMAAGRLLVISLLLSVVIFYRGHHSPGGGFIGGLVAAGGFIFYMLAYGVRKARRRLGIRPLWLMAGGLSVALAAALIPLLTGSPFFTGKWIRLAVFSIEITKAGTPLLFDFGVYLAVLGGALAIIFNTEEDKRQ